LKIKVQSIWYLLLAFRFRALKRRSTNVMYRVGCIKEKEPRKR